jgi:hypothetical protein
VFMVSHFLVRDAVSYATLCPTRPQMRLSLPCLLDLADCTQRNISKCEWGYIITRARGYIMLYTTRFSRTGSAAGVLIHAGLYLWLSLLWPLALLALLFVVLVLPLAVHAPLPLVLLVQPPRVHVLFCLQLHHHRMTANHQRQHPENAQRDSLGRVSRPSVL